MQESFTKRLLFVTKIILGVFVLSIILTMHKSATKDQNENLKTLRLLQLTGDELKLADNPIQFDILFRKWLEKTDSKAYSRHVGFRSWFTLYINTNGIPDFLSDKRSGASSLIFSKTETSFKIDKINSPAYQKPGDEKIHEVILRYQQTAKPFFISYVVGTDSAILHKRLDSIIRRAPVDYQSPYPIAKEKMHLTAREQKLIDAEDAIRLKVVSVILDRNDSFTIATNSDYMSQFVGHVISIPAKTEKIKVPSIFLLLDSTHSAPALDSLRLKKIDEAYVDMDFNTAHDLMAKDYLKSYESVSVLGFDFSTALIPFAIAFFLLLSAFAALVNLYAAEKQKINLFNADYTDDVFEPAINIDILRFVIWILLPPICLYFSLPIFPLPAIQLILLIVLTIILVVLNGWGWFKSLRSKIRS